MKYIFRGKRIDNGEWVEGWYHECTKGEWLDPVQNGAFIQTFKQLDNGEIILTGIFEVDPATVGKFVTNDLGFNVFEGDIFFENHYEDFFVVEWDEKEYCFNASYDTCCECLGNALDKDVDYRGNIYDNPKLLQAE